MYTEMALTARRFALTLAVAGIAGLGSIAVAPDASAAPGDLDGPRSVVHTNGGNGPDAFIVSDHGSRPVFFCEPQKANKQHNTCTVPASGPVRF